MEVQLQRLVDQLPARDVVPVDQGDGDALVARAAGAAHTVQEGLLVLRRLVIDDVGHTLDIDTARGDVGAHQHVDLAVAERAQRLLARTLAQVAVDGAGREAALLQLLGDVGRRALGTAEDHGQATALGLQDAGDELRLVHVVRTEDVLRDVGDGRALAVLGDGADVGRLRHVAAGQADDRTRHGRREQHRLTLRGQVRHDLLDVGQEAQVEHLVGLVQDEGLDAREVELLLPGQVEQAARGTDDHVDALLERLDLGLVRAAAVYGEDADVADLARGQEVVGDLGAQLAGRNHHEGLRGVGQLRGGGAAGLDVRGDDDPLQQGKAETERLAGSGLGLADDVRAGKGDGEGHLLDREGGHDADGLKGLGRLGENPEVSERSQGAASSVRRGARRRGGSYRAVLAVLLRTKLRGTTSLRSSASAAEGAPRGRRYA